MANFSKSITHSLLALVGVGAVLTLAEAAQAFTVSQVTEPGFAWTVGDKRFSDFAVVGTTTEGNDIVTIEFVGGNYQVNYDSTTGGIGSLTTPGSLSYKVSILPGYTNTFLAAGTDAQGGPLLAPKYTKTLNATDLPTLTVTSTSGAQVSYFTNTGLKTINVTSSWSLGSPEVIDGVTYTPYVNDFSDKFIQYPTNPQPVPEPLTILGTGVVLGALPVLKKEYAKRKKKGKDA